MDNHHQPGEEASFLMRPVKYFRTALKRQLAEAVRIGRRGGAGAVLNSREEYNRCEIPRLSLEPTSSSPKTPPVKCDILEPLRDEIKDREQDKEGLREEMD